MDEQDSRSMVQEFKDFLMKGNLVEIAVAFVLAVFFAAVVTSFVDDIVMQIVAAVFGEPDFSRLSFGLGDAEIRYGAFLNTLIAFAIVGFVLFLIVKAYNAYNAAQDDDGPSDNDLLVEIRDSLRTRT